MADPAFYRNANLETIGWYAVAVTPADGADLPKLAAKITAAVAGNIAVVPSGGGASVVLGIQAGGLLPVFVDRVLSTGTTATGIVAIYGQ